MKLLFCIKALSTQGGGAERVFANIVNGLSARGHDVEVLVFEKPDASSFYPLSPAIARDGLGLDFSSGKPAGFPYLALRRRIEAARPDCVIGFMPSCYVPLALALAGSGLPVIASEHNVPARYRGLPLKWLLINLVPVLVKAITAVSEQARREYPPLVRNKMRVMPNPVVPPTDGRADTDGRGDRRTVLAVGRLHPQKDHLTLVRAFASLADDFPDWDLRIVGEGDERPAIEAEIARLGMDGRVTLPGATSEISRAYLSAQIFAMPSRFESYGLATAEAFAHGLPAIGFADCPGTNELIVDGINGLLVEPAPSRIESLAAGLKRLMADAALRRTLAAGATASSAEHGIKAVLDRWQALIETAARR